MTEQSPTTLYNPYSTPHEGILRPQLHILLSARQSDVLALLSKGMAKQEVAQEFGVSQDSVRELAAKGFRYLAASSKQEAIETLYGLGQDTLDPYYANRYELTSIENSVFQLILEGDSNQRITQKLGTSKYFVDGLFSRSISLRMDALNRSHAVSIAHGLFGLTQPKRTSVTDPVSDRLKSPATRFGLTTGEGNTMATIAMGIGIEGSRYALGLARRDIRSLKRSAFQKIGADSPLHAIARLYDLTPDPKIAEQYDINQSTFQAVDLAIQGLSNPAIGRRLNVTPSMVSEHIKQAEASTKARSLTHMASILCGLVEWPDTYDQSTGTADKGRWSPIIYSAPYG